MKTPREIIEDAIDLLNEKGWCQGSTWLAESGEDNANSADEAVAFCLGGALIAAGGEDSISQVYGACSQKAGVPNDEHLFLEGWNDAPGRTKDEVIDLLKDVYAELPL